MLLLTDKITKTSFGSSEIYVFNSVITGTAAADFSAHLVVAIFLDN